MADRGQPLRRRHEASKQVTKKGKFVGGAQSVRKVAQRRRGVPFATPLQEQRAATTLPDNLPPMERMFAALLRSFPYDFLKSHRNKSARESLMKEICSRVNVPAPGKLHSIYSDLKTHYNSRASLVLEEARHMISDELEKRWNSEQALTYLIKDMEIGSVEIPRSAKHKVLCLTARHPLTPLRTELRPGTCVELSPPGNEQLHSVLLGNVVGYIPRGSQGDDNEGTDRDGANEHSLAVMVYSTVPKPTKGYSLTPLVSLISLVRQFTACTQVVKVPFWAAVLGSKQPSHIKFNKDTNQQALSTTMAEILPFESELSIEEANPFKSEPSSEKPSLAKRESSGEEPNLAKKESSAEEPDGSKPSKLAEEFELPGLNATQKIAAESFLSSDEGRITLVQGPPGCGKSTLITAIICRNLHRSKSKQSTRRTMVCAPSNKAVTVLAERFLEAMSCDNCPYSAVLVGDQDKLFSDNKSSLRAMFVYTWVGTYVNEWRSLVSQFGSTTGDSALLRAKYLEEKLTRQLPHLVELQELCDLTSLISKRLVEMFACVGQEEKYKPIHKCASDSVKALSRKFEEIGAEMVVEELLQSAHIVFCTLGSAGSSVVRNTRAVHDLIVDEAAAATEPELYIPFHLRPQRLLAVGDHKQLPATVMSLQASKFGLSTSLHERLIHNCAYKQTMLDIQYRMRPEISLFPSKTFYCGGVANGENVSLRSYTSKTGMFDGQPYCFVHVEGREKHLAGGSIHNAAEANAVISLLLTIKRMSLQRGTERWASTEKLRVITFYQAQVSLIRRYLWDRGLGEVAVATVDSSQGCEADTVIISLVRQGRNNSVGFLNDDRRINVALTRAKHQLFLVGDAKGMLVCKASNTIQALANDAQERGCIRDLDVRNQNKNNRRPGHQQNGHKRRRDPRDLRQGGRGRGPKQPRFERNVPRG